MSLRDRAIAAHTDADTTLRRRAREALTAIGINRADGLEVQWARRIDRVPIVLLSDGDVHLAVRDLGNALEISLVDVDAAGELTWRGRITSLADLGRHLTS
jgi:hypothetical protein